MKKIILIISLLLSGFASFSFANSNVYISPSVQHRLDNALDKFFQKIQAKYPDKKTQYIVLKKIIIKVQRLEKQVKNPFIRNVLLYIDKKINSKMHEILNYIYGHLEGYKWFPSK